MYALLAGVKMDIDSCLCPRASEQKLIAPRCAGSLRATPKPLLFIEGEMVSHCQKAGRFYEHYICTCNNRLHIRRAYGI